MHIRNNHRCPSSRMHSADSSNIRPSPCKCSSTNYPAKFPLSWLTLVLCSVLYTSPVMSWEFAVTTTNKILFYDTNWSLITTAAHQFDELTAIAFDESQEEIFFNDHQHNNGSIFSVKLSRENNDNHQTERILSKTRNESIAGMAFDPVDRYLYWTDMHNQKIFRMSQKIEELNPVPEVVMDFSETNELPDGIAIDFCRQMIYWTNSYHKNATVSRASLNGTQHREVLKSGGYLPHGIVVDEHSRRIFWVDDQRGIHYSIESANLDGTDPKTVYRGKNGSPMSLAVTQSHIFWTDTTDNVIWSIPKNADNETEALKVLSLPDAPNGIVARVGLFQKLENNADCKNQIKKIRSYLLSPKILDYTKDRETIRKRREYCLHRGDYSPLSGECVCKVGYTGRRCEVEDCHNYCVHGTCAMSSAGFPHCTCQEGFYGERCQSSKCTNYCLNDGRCRIRDGKPSCDCTDSHMGLRCETNITEVCLMYCKYGQNNTEWIKPTECPDTCDEQALVDFKPRKFAVISEETCRHINYTQIIVIAGVVVALALALLIAESVRRLYKPARPRIKKRFVVQKNITQTPLTSRPVATEQCEITIENCCNMNICDTPCFDPKLLQENRSSSCDGGTKEDKKILINHMEDDLY